MYSFNLKQWTMTLLKLSIETERPTEAPERKTPEKGNINDFD